MFQNYANEIQHPAHYSKYINFLLFFTLNVLLTKTCRLYSDYQHHTKQAYMNVLAKIGHVPQHSNTILKKI